MARDFLFWSYFKEACLEPECPFCVLNARGMQHYLRSLLYENVLDGHLRLRLLKAGGFCHEHAWKIQQVEQREWQDGLGVAILYEAVLEAALAALREEAVLPATWRERWAAWRQRSRPMGERLAWVLMPHGPCPACESQMHTELFYVQGTARRMEDPEDRPPMESLLKHSVGLCRKHLALMMAWLTNQEIAAALLLLEQPKLERWMTDLAAGHPPAEGREPPEIKTDRSSLERVGRMACPLSETLPLRLFALRDGEEEPGDWERAFAHRGCPFCFRVKARESALLQAFGPGHEGMLCPAHFRIGLSLNESAIEMDPFYGEARILLRGFQEAVSESLAALPGFPKASPGRGRPRSGKPFAALSDALARPVPCPICQDIAAFENACTVHFTALLGSPAGQDRLNHLFEESFGLCLPHLRGVLARADDSGAAYIKALQTPCMASLLAELSEYIRRHDYRYKELPWGAEFDSWIRVIELCVGKNRDTRFKTIEPIKEVPS